MRRRTRRYARSPRPVRAAGRPGPHARGSSPRARRARRRSCRGDQHRPRRGPRSQGRWSRRPGRPTRTTRPLLAWVPRSSRSRRARGRYPVMYARASSMRSFSGMRQRGGRVLGGGPWDECPHTDAVTAVSSRHLAAPTWGKRDRAKGPAMASRTYQNFDLLLEAAEGGAFRARVTTSPLGESPPAASSRCRSTRPSWRTCCSSSTPAAAAPGEPVPTRRARRRWIWVGRCSRVCSPRTSC